MLRSYVDGQWEDGTGVEIADLDPSRRGRTIDTFRAVGPEQVDRACHAADQAFHDWRRTTAFDRAEVVRRAAGLLDLRAEAYGEDLTREEGKTRAEGIGEVRRAAEVLRYHAAEAAQEVGAVYSSARAGETIWTRRVPVGPVAVITPWNFPAFIPAFKLGPALVHGNTVVWKPSELVPMLSVRLVEVLSEAGLPGGVLNLLLGDGAAAQRLIADERIRACTFTGSTPIGRSVVAACATRGIKVQAEMGGKNTVIVFDDADIELAADAIVSGSMRSTGQKCTATSRVIVSASIADRLATAVTERTRQLTVGDPLHEATDVGPVASEAQHRRVMEHLEAAKRDGAQALCGGGEGPSSGWFIEPTVLAGVSPTSPAFTEEIFGPVVALVPAQDDDEAFALANTGPYGLSGAVFTSSFDRVLRAEQDLDVGVLHINSETTGADVHVPFGGVKASGTAGREQGKTAVDFYTEIRTVYAAPSA